MSLTDVDPTGTLSAASAAIGLVGSVLRVAPAIINLKNTTGGASLHHAASQSGPSTLHRTETAPGNISSFPKDPERERRAYETVNFVLREIGTRLCGAGLVDEHALTRALTGATQHIEVKLFSGEANRLFESLAPRLGDPILVNAVFTSIYLIGALTAELTSSLPNYKESYAPLGPRMVQQLFRAAIGEDAFRENLSANLDAYKTLTTTAGLLRPTDIGYHMFPKFPSLGHCRYSSKSFNDVRHNKNYFEKLVKHFDRVGFPQPNSTRQAEVGLIRDWRFLSSDSNSRNFDVEKADKNIGENFGKVLHWLICSAERIPPGTAIIAYYDQHIELVKWIGHRMGNAILYPSWDLMLTGPHSQLEGKLQSILHSWVILMHSPYAQSAKKAASDQWMQSRMVSAAQAPLVAAPSNIQGQQHQPQRHQSSPHSVAQVRQSVSSPPINVASAGIPRGSVPDVSLPASPPLAAVQTSASDPRLPEMVGSDPMSQTVEQQLEGIQRHFYQNLLPACQHLLSQPPLGPRVRETECNGKIFAIEKEVVYKLDGLQLNDNEPARLQRKEVVLQAQDLIGSLTIAASTSLEPAHTSSPPLKEKIPSKTGTTSPLQSSAVLGSPPPYSPSSANQAAGAPPTSPDASAFLQKRTSTVIRRKAPPPPRKFGIAVALFDFEPDTDNAEELGFAEGDEIEIIEKTAALEEEGWCRGRIRGQKKMGLMPLEYLEIRQGSNPSEPSKIPTAETGWEPSTVQSATLSGQSSPPHGSNGQRPANPSVHLHNLPELTTVSHHQTHHLPAVEVSSHAQVQHHANPPHAMSAATGHLGFGPSLQTVPSKIENQHPSPNSLSTAPVAAMQDGSQTTPAESPHIQMHIESQANVPGSGTSASIPNPYFSGPPQSPPTLPQNHGNPHPGISHQNETFPSEPNQFQGFAPDLLQPNLQADHSAVTGVGQANSPLSNSSRPGRQTVVQGTDPNDTTPEESTAFGQNSLQVEINQSNASRPNQPGLSGPGKAEIQADPVPSPVADLSAFSEPPFQAQAPTSLVMYPVSFETEPAFVPEDDPVPSAETINTVVTTTTDVEGIDLDPRTGLAETAEVEEETTVAQTTEVTNLPSSPLASLATTAPLANANVAAQSGIKNDNYPLGNSTTFVDTQSSLVMPMTQSTSQPVFQTINQTQWEASDATSDTSLDMDY